MVNKNVQINVNVYFILPYMIKDSKIMSLMNHQNYILE